MFGAIRVRMTADDDDFFSRMRDQYTIFWRRTDAAQHAADTTIRTHTRHNHTRSPSSDTDTQNIIII